MTPASRFAFIGNSLPRRCGIATFTTDLQQAIANLRADIHTGIVAMTDHGHAYEYPSAVQLQINDGKLEEYVQAADFLNTRKFEVVSLQHEFGIFGGDAGSHILALLWRLCMPIVTTLHTVLSEPKPNQRDVLIRIIDASAKVVVMAEKARELLGTVYAVPGNKIEVIPHGVPDFDFVAPDSAKAKLGFSGKAVILTFGLLSPNKGIEVMIDAMPAILERRPDAVYVVLGATHPNLVRQEGEGYRQRLMARVQSLGLGERVVFLDQFVDRARLLDFIAMCDVYVTPYLNEAQMTSGTLAYSFGLGKAVVSTPYWHARELLANGRGILVPFGDAAKIGTEIAGLLTDDVRRDAMRARSYAGGRSMTWERTAERYLSVFDRSRNRPALKVVGGQGAAPLEIDGSAVPQMQVGHFLAMCDDTGLFQHAVHSVPNRSHGYCVDDNARALLVACMLDMPGEQRLPEVLTAHLAAFVQHAWNPDTGRFRNFMSFDRRWLEEIGSEDSHGRALWALGECARADASTSRQSWARALFAQSVAAVEHFDSPRAWAFALLGLEGYCAAVPADSDATGLQIVLADRLMGLLSAIETRDWVWFEAGLSYDNARLPHALIVAGLSTGVAAYVASGLRSLRWLMGVQTSESGFFRPVGSESFGDTRRQPRAFDQQPLEAAAAISACRAAWRADGDPQWKTEATRAFAWFFGKNDLSACLVDRETGSCRDGLHPDRANENRGGESVVSYLLSVGEIRRLVRVEGVSARPSPIRTLRS
ncbi:MAG TPA: glycosyltransferase family 4 protein [Steroidobacteraceae bacterium]